LTAYLDNRPKIVQRPVRSFYPGIYVIALCWQIMQRSPKMDENLDPLLPLVVCWDGSNSEKHIL